MIPTNRESITTIIYSSLFLLTLETLILRISPQIFPLINTLPIIFIGQILKFELFLSSLIVSNFLIFILCISEVLVLEKNIALNFFFHYLIVSSLAYFFFAVLKSSLKRKKSSEGVIITFILAVTFLLISLILFYFSTIDYSNLKTYFSGLSENFIENSKSNKTIINQESIENIIKIIPSINAFVFLTTFMINFHIASFFSKKLNFETKYKIFFDDFYVPRWYFLTFFLLIIFSFLLNSDLKFYCVNSSIVLSFIFFFQGFRIFNRNFDKYKINGFVKILIIFLLFIFLGYVLILIIFFLGFYNTFKRIFLRKIEKV